MRRCARPLLAACSLLALTACGDRGPDPLARAGDVAGSLNRTALGEFTIHFDHDGGRVEVAGVDGGLAPAEIAPGLLAEARVVAPWDDVGLATIAWGFSPPGGCVPAASWGYTVQLTNNGVETWYSPLAQLFAIVPGEVTACNSDDTELPIPDRGAAVADWEYGVDLTPGNSTAVQWGFAPNDETGFTVRGVITIGDPHTCGGVPANDPGVCSGHGTCVSQDSCDCDPGYHPDGPGACEKDEEITCVAMFDFEAEDEEELSVKEGEKVTLVDDTGEWLLVRNSEGQEGYVPTSYLKCGEA